MKPSHLMVFTILFCLVITPMDLNSKSEKKSSKRSDDLNQSGLEFFVHNEDINTKYSEYASATFRNKLIVVSSKKIGGLGNGVDQNTNEPFTELFCLDIDGHGNISNPLFFSRIINTKDNEGQVSFSPDENTMYFTRSSRENSKNHKLYKTILEGSSNGNWTDELIIGISSEDYSIENPHVTSDGKQLYFSSNMEESLGGFDIYVSNIREDGSIETPQNLGPTINTAKDEKFPHTSKDGKKLFFSSRGHHSIGGYDIFLSSIINDTFKAPRNLGIDINSKQDEIALVFANNDRGFFSSNKLNGEGGFDIYRFKANAIYQQLQGIVVSDNNQPLPNTTVLLLDELGIEIERQTTGIDAHYSFKVKAFEMYSIKVLKKGFENFESTFSSYQIDDDIYREILKLSTKVATIRK